MLTAFENLLNRRPVPECLTFADMLGVILTLTHKIFRMYIADVQKAVFAYAEIYERSLNRGSTFTTTPL
jgi:hypothetical protein